MAVMTGAGRRVPLFLDVDGPLIPFGGTSGYRTYASQTGVDGANPLVSRIDPGIGARLAGLACELVWATSWLEEANECVAPWLGLPPLPVVRWPDVPEGEDDGLHWKTRTLVEWADRRPFAWADDEITTADRIWVARHHPGEALLLRIDPRHGLAEEDFAVLGEWLRGL